MMVVRAKEAASVEMRKVYAATMAEMAREDKRVVAMDCDLVNPIGMTGFKKEFPRRMIDCGIMEANMTGMAAGASAIGCIPFTHTFACFQARKCLDQIFLSAGFADLNVKMVGSDPGILALYNGASHMALEDMGILMNVPNLTLLEPTDAVMLRALLRQVKETYGLHYIRMNRKDAPTIYDEATEFAIGKGMVLREGTDVTIIASGLMVEQSLLAADALHAEGIEARVVDMFTWRPIDEELILESAAKTGAIVTAENHRLATGLGSAVAHVLTDNAPVPLGRIGIGERYGEVGDLPYLLKCFRLTAQDIADMAKRTISRKQ